MGEKGSSERLSDYTTDTKKRGGPRSEREEVGGKTKKSPGTTQKRKKKTSQGAGPKRLRKGPHEGFPPKQCKAKMLN